MARLKKMIVMVGVVVGLSAVSSCGSWIKCLSGNSCAKSAENAATSQLFLNSVSSSLTSFKAVMAELGLTDAQQSTVVSTVQAKAQELTTQLGLADSSTYSGTVLEKLTSMFTDLIEYAVTKISEVAPDLDETTISNAIASFANDLLAFAGEENILGSLPDSEQANLPTGADGHFDVQETLGSTVAQAAVGGLIAQRPNANPGDMMAAMEHFERKPGEKPKAPGQVREYRPSEADRVEGQSRVQGDICQGSPASMGGGRGRTPNASQSDRIPLPMQGCAGVAIDQYITFCLTAPDSAFKICPKPIYGSGVPATKTSIKFWVDGAENLFTGFTVGKVYDCSDAAAKKELAQLLGSAITAKKSTCAAFALPASSVSAGGGG